MSKQSTNLSTTVWPSTPTVAVSEASYRKQDVCWKTVELFNPSTGKQVQAVIVDFCPASGCNWGKSERANNVDIYGSDTWKALGGKVEDSTMPLQITWPPGVFPSSSSKTSRGIGFLILILLVI